MKIVGILLAIWLVIGVLAGLQRHYYTEGVSCAKAGTVVATIAAGPLNYIGANPTIRCRMPQPSK